MKWLPICVILAAPAAAQTVDSVLDDAARDTVELSRTLDGVRDTLRDRAKRADDTATLRRLDPVVPPPRKTGYRLLPELTADSPRGDVPLRRIDYDLRDLMRRGDPALERAGRLRSRAASAPLSELVDELEDLKRELKFQEDLVAYHRYWQKAAIEHREFFALRNRLLPKATRLKSLLDENGDATEIARLRTVLVANVAPFQKTAGLRVETTATGQRVLRVKVLTDIADDSFLSEFRAAVRREFDESAAFRDAKLRILLSLQAFTPYPDGAPAKGAAIDENVHLARFPQDALVLTTGANSTHAFQGRYIHLGTAPTSPRTLAHEFGHLLGFADAYLRGFEVRPSDPLGCRLIEWTGLQDDLMGSPATGHVTPQMVQLLLRAYGE